MNELTYEEWLERSGGKLKDNQFQTAVDMANDFQKFHGSSIHDEIDRMNRYEYQLYLQRVDAGVEDV